MSTTNVDKISVIVPAFNQEKYLERCIKSLINQTYSNLEIIIVDDGSIDLTPSICDNLEKKYENIKVIHKENGGLSSARNAGMRIASGKYVAFVDSDDWIAYDTYTYAMKLMKDNKADIVQFSYMYAYKETDSQGSVSEIINIYREKDILQYYMLSTTKTGSYGVCWYIIPKCYLDGEAFREGKINEDIDFMYKILAKCSSIVTSNIVKYFYFQQTSSLSTGGLKKKDFDLYEAAEELYKLAENETYGNIAQLALVKKARTPLSLLSKIALYGIQDKTIDKKSTVKSLQRELRNNIFILLAAPLPISRKGLAVIFSINYWFAEWAIKIVYR